MWDIPKLREWISNLIPHFTCIYDYLFILGLKIIHVSTKGLMMSIIIYLFWYCYKECFMISNHIVCFTGLGISDIAKLTGPRDLPVKVWKWISNFIPHFTGIWLLNSMALERFGCDFRNVILKLVSLIGIFRSPYDNNLRWTALDLPDNKSTLVQVMAWCHQATSHYLSRCWPRPMSPYGVTRAQWVKVVFKDLSWSMLVKEAPGDHLKVMILSWR